MRERVYDRATPTREGTVTAMDDEKLTLDVRWDDTGYVETIEVDQLGAVPPPAVMELSREQDELRAFLDQFFWIYPNLNDTFYYASADSERIVLDGETNTAMLIDVWRRFGHHGITAYVAKMRGHDPLIPQVRDHPQYVAAKLYLEERGWQYEQD